MSRRAKGVYIPSVMFDSKGYKTLTKAEMLIHYEFMLKRRFAEQKNKRSGSKPNILNNGEITFTFGEAERLGYPRPTFQRAIDKLVEVGFIDIAVQGIGGMVSDDGKIKGEPTMYSISDRWENYGTSNFVEKKRKKDTRKGRGWAAYHAKKKQDQKTES